MSRALAATVHLAAGTGHVVRRHEALLFLPRPDDTVRAAFVAASPGDELQAVASATVAAGFEVGAYVCVGWRSPVRVMVFGDLAVETDQPSVPMFTGAGSRTWVEQTIPVEAAATVAVAGADGQADQVTDLRDGIAHAAGFLLRLRTGDATEELPVDDVAAPVAADADAAGSGDPTTALPAPIAAEPDTSQAEPALADPVATAPADAPETPDAPAETEPSPAPPRPTGHDVASDVARDPALALAAIQAAAMNEEGEPVHAPEPGPPAVGAPMATPSVDVLDDRAPVDDLDDDHTLPPPEPSELLGELAADGRGALVEAKVCSEGHPNPPMVATCAICGALLSPGAAAVTHVRRPSLGALRLDDGEVVALDQELLIGRNPARDREPSRSELRRVPAVGDKVSRSHLEVRFQGWDLLVVDCGSTNGSFVVPHPGGQVVALEPNRAHLVEPDAVVYFGSRSFTVVGRGR